MFGKFLRWYRVNKTKFWTVLLSVVGGYCLIRILNMHPINMNKKEKQNPMVNYYNASTIKSNKSATTLKSVEPELLNTANKVIDNFISLLNKGDYVSAYNLLTDDCKIELYSSIEVFRNNYYDKIFKTYKSYNMQNWVDNTYKIEYRENLLDTGGVESKSYTRDYITVVRNGNDVKLNINSFIGREKVRKRNKL